ncbi:enoyl-CoA hydratase/isomerase family protein [Paracidobacterium acidisoli]|uniref:Enoyl-CoA hydratase n=1 Tax=Paracidobacterium acidisoli TaxID=2303751 RepID=A0A372IUH5_9BACT|nr:enoyl-CoA hydratase-related protein [Paracidobacterium acidisoli]MBT9330048.1 enoyl-CoA hydratase/isomerase family protein [Paracidobacterium acidisoli]
MNHYQTLHAHTDTGIHTIVLNRPAKRNALNPQMMEELTHALETAGKSPACGVIILTGAGSAFCAGLDLDHLETLNARTTAEHRTDSERVANLLMTLYHTPKPTIAAVNGAAIAGGMGIATICDFTLSVPEAKFGYTEVRIGFVPAIVSAFLRGQVGDKRCRDLLMTGRLMNAEEAEAWGLLTRVIPEQDLMREARTLAHSLLRNSPAAVQATKRLLSEHANHHLLEEIESAIRANTEARTTEDFKEGIRSFLEKRPPQWPSQRELEKV